MKFKDFARKHWRIWYVSYIFIYLPWFFAMEHLVTDATPNLHIMHSFVDDMIPFCEYFIIPYGIWFVYIAVSCFFMYFKGTDEEYRRFAWSLIIGMSTCMIICLIYPNGVDMRPASLERNNICARIIKLLWATDTSTNVFPSIHVYNSLAIHIGLVRSKALENNKGLKALSLVTCILICMSTLFLKQHSFIDVLGACILMTILYYFIYVPAEERRLSFRRA